MKLFLTIDVETYTGDYALDVRGYGKGLDYILARCNDYGVKATFFVEALGATRWGEDGLRDVCSFIEDHGHEVQLHLHPCVADIEGFVDKGDVFCAQGRAAQSQLISVGRDILDRCSSGDIVALRVGDFAANEVTLRAMVECGISLSSNRDLDCKTTIQSQINDLFPVANDLSCHNGIWDLPLSAPLSSIPAIDGRHRHLQVCAVGGGEMIDVLEKMCRAGYETATILSHPGEFFAVRGKGTRSNTKNCDRLEKLLGFISGCSDIEPVTMSECRERCRMPKSSPPAVRFNTAHSITRILQQGASRLLGPG